MRQLILFSLVLVTSFLSLGTVLKKKDAIQRTQTDPIGYQEKAKEEAEGKKGPPVPALELFPKERFLVEGPVEKTKGKALKKVEVVKENEELEETFKLEGETDDTSEETWEFDNTQGEEKEPSTGPSDQRIS